MATLERLAALDLRLAVTRFRDALRAHQDELNRMNVYPVPDGDTGTNMTLTLESVVHELGSAEDMAEVCQAVAHGSLMGARGNSGVILSQVLRGLADTFRTLEAAGPSDFAVGLRHASDAAYEAVMRPVEGTILTVVRAAAEAAEVARDAGEQALVGVLDSALVAARDAVARTPDLLPVLKEAGVVDAGGHGFTLLLDALLEVVAGRPIPEPEVVNTPISVEAHLAGDDLASLRYEVMYLLEAQDSTIDAFKQTWAALGDSIVVVGGEGLWNCHVHTDDIGGAIEAGIEAGRPRQVRVADLLEQVEEEQWVRDQDAVLAGVGAEETADHRPAVATAVVAVGVGVGIRRLLVSLGVHEIVAGGQSMNPSTAQILEAVDRCPSDAVVILPNNKNIIPVAQQVDGLTTRKVSVVPTTSVVEALAALVAYDPQAELGDNVDAMNEAAGRVAAGEVTQAVRDSVAECGPIAEGDWLAIRRDGICATASNPVDAALALVTGLITEDSEIVTVLVGSEARGADTERVRQQVALAHSNVEVEVHEGGQPLYPYLIGVE
jgi:DAK2 domain fusion protein YloV